MPEMDFKNFFCWSSNLSNDDIISQKPGLKTGMDFIGQVTKWVGKIILFGLKQGQDLENRAAYPHQEFPGVPPWEAISEKGKKINK